MVAARNRTRAASLSALQVSLLEQAQEEFEGASQVTSPGMNTGYARV